MLNIYLFSIRNMAVVAQLVRAPVCGTGGRGFESRQSPFYKFIKIYPASLL